MNRLKNSLFLLSLVSSVPSVFADFTHVSVWQRVSKSGEKQLLVMCDDVHSKMKVGLDQAEEIVRLLADNPCKDNHIIVEDIHDIKGFGRRIDAFFDQYPDDTERARAKKGTDRVAAAFEEQRAECIEKRVQDALFLLPYLARQQGISVVDIDSREFLSCDAMRFNVEEYTNGHLIIPFLHESLIGEIASFDDGSLLNAKYAEILARYVPYMCYVNGIMEDKKLIFQDLPIYFTDLFMDAPDDFNPTFVASIETTDLSSMHENLKRALCNFKAGRATDLLCKDLMWILTDLLELSSAELVDAMLLHAIYTKQVLFANGNTVFVCAGKAHNDVVSKLLPELGYELLGQASDAEGVAIAALCEPHMLVQQSGNPVGFVWSYVVDAFGSVIEYAVGLFS